MKTFIDNRLLQRINEGSISIPSHFSLTLPWSSFLEYLELGTLLEDFPKFDEQNPLFNYLVSPKDLDKDVVIRLYDQIFVECLTQIKAIEKIKPHFLLQKLQDKEKQPLLSLSLREYEKKLQERPYEVMHDLILHLAFDRVCVFVSLLFEHPSSKEDKMKILKDCLIESFSHIKQDGKTSPGFFRLVEALYAYQMREERLQMYSEAEWVFLCESACALKSRKALIDSFYIDIAIELKEKEVVPIQMFTLDSKDIVNARLKLAFYVIQKIQIALPEWSYSIHPFFIHYI